MPALPALSGRNEASSVHRNGAAHRKATAESSAATRAGQTCLSSRTLRISARSAFHDPERAERDGEQHRHADQGGGGSLANLEVFVGRLENVIEQQVGGI